MLSLRFMADLLRSTSTSSEFMKELVTLILSIATCVQVMRIDATSISAAMEHHVAPDRDPEEQRVCQTMRVDYATQFLRVD